MIAFNIAQSFFNSTIQTLESVLTWFSSFLVDPLLSPSSAWIGGSYLNVHPYNASLVNYSSTMRNGMLKWLEIISKNISEYNFFPSYGVASITLLLIGNFFCVSILILIQVFSGQKLIDHLLNSSLSSEFWNSPQMAVGHN